MPFLSWSKDYSIKIRAIDNDHKELFDCVNELHRAIQDGDNDEEVSYAISLLARYVKEHFDREEQLMAKYGYPKVAEHKAEHQKLRRMVQAIWRIHADTPTRIDTDKLLAFLCEWLTKHILGSDMRYARYLLGSKAPDDAGDARTDEQTCETEVADTPTECKVTVKVPAEDAILIERLALLLRKGGEQAATVQAFARSIDGIDLEESLALAAPVLR